MTVQRDEGRCDRASGRCGVEDAEALQRHLLAAPRSTVEWSACEHLHSAVIQVLLAGEAHHSRAARECVSANPYRTARCASSSAREVAEDMTYKLLIVDDSKLARMAVVKALNSCYPDWQRVEAGSAADALSAMEARCAGHRARGFQHAEPRRPASCRGSAQAQSANADRDHFRQPSAGGHRSRARAWERPSCRSRSPRRRCSSS